MTEVPSLRDPDDWITEGYDIHLIFDLNELAKATALFEAFVEFVESAQIAHHRPKIFPLPVGPWPTPMWQVLLPRGENSDRDLGRCVSWLMLNHGHFSVMVHPNTRADDERGGAIEDHSENMFWIGSPRQLLLNVLT